MNTNSEYSSYNNNVPSNPSSSAFDTTDDSSMFSNKNGIIIFLLILVILSFLGINMLSISGNILEEISKIFGPTVKNVASMLGYSAGELVDTTANVGADVAKLGVDIAEGSVHSVGKILKTASKGEDHTNLELSLSRPKPNPNTPEKSPEPSQSADLIHRSISSKKSGWCFVGEDAGSRGCVSVDEHDKCMSGQIFPSKESCMNPSPE